MILTVILTILKFIGITLASILGLLLFIIILIMFVPFRYNIKALRRGENDTPPVEAKAYISWLFHFIHVSVVYPGNTIMCIRILGIPIYRYPDNKEAQRKEKKQTSKKNKKQKSESVKPENLEPKAEKILQKEDNQLLEESVNIADDSFTKRDEDVTKTKVSIFSRIKNFFINIKCTISHKYDKIKTLISDVNYRAKHLKKDIHYYHNILTSDLFEKTFEKCKKKLIRLLKSIGPKIFKVNFEVGFDDPYVTGEVLAIAGILYPITTDHIQVVGNFEDSCIKGAAKIKGCIFVFCIVFFALYILLDRDIKRLIRLFKKEGTKNGRSK